MKAICLFFLFSLTQSTFAQWPEFNQAHPVSCQWPAYNYTAHGEPENIFVIDAPNNFYDGYLAFGNGVLCHPDSVVNYTRCFAAKFNTYGDLVWWNRFDDNEIDMSEQWFNKTPGNMGGMIQNHSDQIVSTFSTFVSGDEDDVDSRNYLVKVNFNGVITEQHLIDSSLARYANIGIIEDFSDSTYVSFGWYQDSLDVIHNIEPDAFLLKIDSLGNHIWQKEYSDTYATLGVVKAMDGGFWVGANTTPLGECPDGFYNLDFVLIKTDELGNEQDRIIFGGNCGHEIATVHEYEEDKVVLVGRLTNEDNGPGESYRGYYFTTLIEQQFNEMLLETTPMKKYLNAYNGNFTDLHYLPNDGYLIVSDNQLSPQQGAGTEIVYRWKGCLMKLDMNRDSVWMRSYAYYNNALDGDDPWQVGEHYILDSKPTPDGGWVCSGYVWQLYSDPNPFLNTPWLFKVDSLGCLEPGCQNVGVKEIVIGLQNTMSVYPNPVVDVCTLQWNVELASKVQSNFSESQIIIIDAMGREVQRQPVNNFGSQFQLQIDMSSFSPGLYQAHWVSGGSWLDSVQIIKQ
jgi:hypothetical protein